MLEKYDNLTMKLKKDQLKAIHAKNYVNSIRTNSRINVYQKGTQFAKPRTDDITKSATLKHNNKEFGKITFNSAIDSLSNNFSINALGKISAPLLSSIIGIPIPYSFTASTIRSINYSFNVYCQTERIDEHYMQEWNHG